MKLLVACSFDLSMDQLLRDLGLLEAADYLQNAEERLQELKPAALADCKTACRNALLSTIKELTGPGEEIKKLRTVCFFGEREEEYLKALEKFLLTSINLLSKAGPHPEARPVFPNFCFGGNKGYVKVHSVDPLSFPLSKH